MAVNRTKVLEAAQKFLAKGQFDKAIAEYQKLVAEDPRDVRTLLKIGDLHTRRNKPQDAIGVYQTVAELYAKQGFFLKAVAVYKQILKLEPDHFDSSLRLAKMYEELGLTNDALTTYERLADAYAAQGNIASALETMARMIELDTQNVGVRIKYAEALSKADRAKEAAQAFAAGARLLKEQGRMDDYLRVVERQLFHDPENVEIARELSQLYLERGDPKRALTKLQVCFKTDPRDIVTLEMLAEAFRQLGQIPKTVSVLKEIARLHGELNSRDARHRTLQRIIELDPSDAEARQSLGNEHRDAPPAREPAPPPAPPPPAKAVEDLEEEEVELEMLEDAVEEIDEVEIDTDDAIEEEDEVLIVDDDADADGAVTPERLLAEAEAHESAARFDEAEAALQRLLSLDRDNEEAHERLKDLYLATDRRVDAVRELLWLSDAWTERNVERAIQHARAAYDLAPHSDATKNRLRMLGVDPDAGAQTTVEEEVMFVDATGAEPPRERAEDELDAILPPVEDELDAILPPVSVAPSAPPAAQPEPFGSEAPSTSLSLLDLPIYPGEFDAAPPRRATELSPALLALLEEPLKPEDFDAAPAAAEAGAADDDFAALLDAPISPDDFEAPPPPRKPVSSLPPNAQELLEAPVPVDDFGLSDPRFETSGLTEVEEPSPADVTPGATAAEWVLDETSSSAETEFAEIGTDEVDLNEPPGFAAGVQAPAAASEAPRTAQSAQTVPPDSEGQAVLLAEQESLGSPRAPALPFEDEELDEAGDNPPDSTVPGAPIPDLLRQARPESTEPPIPEPTTPDLPEPAQRPGLAESQAEAPAPAPSAAAAPAQVAATDEPEEDVLPEIEEVLDEADFFASQGLADEALEVIQEAILIYPTSRALRARLLLYEAKADAQEAAEEQAAEAGDDSFDIAEQLAHELTEVPAPSAADEMIDVESVFAQFKKGVAAQISPDDSETHFDLGIAYKEMGLTDDAIQEFELASNNPKRACSALTMIGMCALEKGDAQEAVSFFQRALATHPSPAEELALLYEIGHAQELLGHHEAALTSFEKVAAADRNFRGVLARVDALKKSGSNSALAR